MRSSCWESRRLVPTNLCVCVCLPLLCPPLPLSLCFSGEWGALWLHCATQHADQVRFCSVCFTTRGWQTSLNGHIGSFILSPSDSFWSVSPASIGPTCRTWKMWPTTSTTRIIAVRSWPRSPATEWTPPRPRDSSPSRQSSLLSIVSPTEAMPCTKH